MRTVTIRVGDQVWSVPFGFGKHYAAIAKDPATPDVLSDLLSLVGYDARPEDIATRSPRERADAEVYAVSVHLRAGDNIVRVPPKPAWLPEPWKGPRMWTAKPRHVGKRRNRTMAQIISAVHDSARPRAEQAPVGHAHHHVMRAAVAADLAHGFDFTVEGTPGGTPLWRTEQ